MGESNHYQDIFVGSAMAIAIALVIAAILNVRVGAIKPKIDETQQSIDRNTSSTRRESDDVSSKQVPESLVHLFDKAAARVKSMQTLTNSQKLLVYGLYKQATEGDAPTNEPSTLVWNPVARAKYSAWIKLKGIPKDDAMITYMFLVNLLEVNGTPSPQPKEQQRLPFSPPIDDFDALMEGFEEFDEIDVFGSGMGMRPSMPSREEDNGDDNDTSLTNRFFPLHLAARKGDAVQLRRLLQQNHDDIKNNGDDDPDSSCYIDNRDESGQTPLHLAADHGHENCVQILLEAGADPNAADLDGITVLQTAVIADRVSIAAMLLQTGANPDQPDADGDTPRSCADGSTTEMQALFAT